MQQERQRPISFNEALLRTNELDSLGPAPALPDFSSHEGGQDLVVPEHRDDGISFYTLPHERENTSESLSKEAMDSVRSAQQIFLSTLNDIAATAAGITESEGTSSQPLATQVLSNLRNAVNNLSPSAEMVSLPSSSKDAASQKTEMNALADLLAAKLPEQEALLVKALAALVACLDRLLNLSGNEQGLSTITTLTSLAMTPNASSSSHGSNRSQFEQKQSMFATLQKQALSLQMSNRCQQRSFPNEGVLEVQKAEVALLWARIDELLARIHDLSNQQSANQSYEFRWSRSKEYEPSISEYSLSDLPIYTDEQMAGTEALLPPSYPEEKPVSRNKNEKLQLDLDNLSDAIERLHAVSPQLSNQRVASTAVLDRSKIREGRLEKLSTAIERLSKGRLEDQRAVLPVLEPMSAKSKETKRLKELDNLWDSIGKANDRRMVDQRVALSPRKQGKMPAKDALALMDSVEAARREHILSTINAGRLNGQDAQLPSSNTRGRLQRSYSTPVPPTSDNTQPVNGLLQDWRWIVQEQANLGCLNVNLWSTESSPEVLDWAVEEVSELALIVTVAGRQLKISLPVPVQTEPVPAISPSASGASIKLKILPREPNVQEEEPLSTLYLKRTAPSSFRCAECKIPFLNRCNSSIVYAALPSEHWAELIDSWVCHQDQELNENITNRNAGFWPADQDVFVASNYLLFPLSNLANVSVDKSVEKLVLRLSSGSGRSSLLVLSVSHRQLSTKRRSDTRVLHRPNPSFAKGLHERAHFLIHAFALLQASLSWNSSWVPAHCQTCRFSLGEIAFDQSDSHSAKAFRARKYAIEPVLADASSPDLPLEVHIAAHLLDISRSHAVHRFFIEDESSTPRLFIWLFNPSNAFTSSSLTGVVRVMAVFYASCNTETEETLSTGQQCERLEYPGVICDRLLASLKESTTLLPSASRVFGQYQSGFIRRL